MEPLNIKQILTLGALATLCVLYKYVIPDTFLWRILGRGRKLPPGPPGLPVFGNMFQFTKARDAGLWAPFVSPQIPLNLEAGVDLSHSLHRSVNMDP